MKSLPSLSRFELQCLRKLWNRREGTVREILDDLGDAPSYSTVRKIVERLEEKGAVERVRKDGKAWVYRSTVSPSAMLRKEIRRFLDVAFDGSAAPLVAQLARMQELTMEDLKELERVLAREDQKENDPDSTADAANGPDAREDSREVRR
jgi:BlaI family penicillinase repressor